jgi:hypothetical protein
LEEFALVLFRYAYSCIRDFKFDEIIFKARNRNGDMTFESEFERVAEKVKEDLFDAVDVSMDFLIVWI